MKRQNKKSKEPNPFLILHFSFNINWLARFTIINIFPFYRENKQMKKMRSKTEIMFRGNSRIRGSNIKSFILNFKNFFFYDVVPTFEFYWMSFYIFYSVYVVCICTYLYTVRVTGKFIKLCGTIRVYTYRKVDTYSHIVFEHFVDCCCSYWYFIFYFTFLSSSWLWRWDGK